MKKIVESITVRLLAALLLSSVALFAQDPGAALGTSLQTMFTGPLIVGLSIVGAVVTGCMIMFGGGGAMRGIGAFLLGAILILDAVKLVTYIQSVI